MKQKNENPTLITVGQVGAAHGVKGGLKIHSHTEPKDQILNYLPWHVKIGQQWQILKVKSAQPAGQYFIVYFENYTDRDQARLLTGAEIAIERDQLPKLAINEFYWQDLIGLSVVNLEGVNLGTVTSLIETGSNDVLIVKQDKKERLIPYLRDSFIKEIDLEKQLILVDWDPDF